MNASNTASAVPIQWVEALSPNGTRLIRSDQKQSSSPTEGSSPGSSFAGSLGLLEWQITYDEPQNILWLRTSGPLDIGPVEALMDGISAAVNHYGCRRLFVDHRLSQLRLDPVQIFDLPKTLRRHGLVEHQAAVLFAKLGDDERFVETICKNHGITARVFTSPELALAWLLGNPG
jgi:hypothetical protein